MIPIHRPQLPPFSRFAGYLEVIDGTRIYSNFGPHVRMLEERLAAQFGVSGGMVTTLANATLGLALALAAQGVPQGSLCAMPGWTFIASAEAAIIAGLTPYFVDVDPRTWALDPFTVGSEIEQAGARVGAVMVVAPFGQPIDYAEWDRFRVRTGLPVVIDAAAAFDTLQVVETPAVVSLHATKIFGIGEGGFVASRDPALIADIRRRSNFGFDHDRAALTYGSNAKLSEYHAAVGLAALDMWSEIRATWMSVACGYREFLAKSNAVRLQPGFGDTWVSSTCTVSLDGKSCRDVRESLAAAGIETRLWWGAGAHNHPATAALPRACLPVTENLARTTFGVPFFQDLQREEMRHITATLLAATSS